MLVAGAGFVNLQVNQLEVNKRLFLFLTAFVALGFFAKGMP